MCSMDICAAREGCKVVKHLVDLDEQLLSAARAAAGEQTIKGTVNKALELLVSQQRLSEQDLRRRWSTLGDVLADLADDDVMRGAWL